jgi:hypothetical protein
MGERRLTGACLCGGVRFELSEPPDYATYCHCTRCQRRSGTAASAEGRIQADTLTILSGEELLRAYTPPGRWHEEFCSTCGSALFSRDPEDPSIMCVALGAIDGDPGVRPSRRQFVAYAAVWEPIPDDGLPRCDESVV